jgi:alpha-L-rhamnosidase
MKFALLLCLSFLTFTSLAQVSLTKLQVEYQAKPLGIDESKPRFSWQMQSKPAARGDRQIAYRIVVQNDKNQIVWDSKKVASDISLGISYAGKALEARTAYAWTVQVWDQKNQVSSAKSSFETGLLNESWNKSSWIGSNDLPLYSHYLSVYKFQYGIQLDEASKSKKASFVFGANDPRLQNKNLNIQGVASAKNSSYIRIELDLSDSTQAYLNVYRAGYDPKDDANKAIFRFEIPKNVISKTNQYQKHTVFATCNFGLFDLYIDQVDKEHKINPSLNTASPFAPSGFNLNPVGLGNNFISYPMLAEIGFQAPEGETAYFSDVQIKNFRQPSNTLFAAEENPGLWPNWDGKRFRVSGSFAVANPSRHAAPMLRTQFATSGKAIKKARIYATARGIYEMFLNGKRVGEDYFNPGLTQYNKTHQYQSFDVTSLLKSGENAWGAWLSEGWWSGNITFSGDNWNYFGDRQSLLAQLIIEYSDGTKQVVNTNPTQWKSFNDGPIRVGSFFQGEVYDAQKEEAIKGWSTTGYSDKSWKVASTIPLEGTAYLDKNLDYSNMHLTGQLDDRVQVRKVLQAQSIQEPRKGVYVYDMGQNMVGFPKIFIPNGKAGQVITLRYAEMLYPDLAEYAAQKGMIMLENIRAALAQDIYVLKGGDEYIQPRFTFHGYRYLEISGLDQAPALPQVAGIVLSSISEISSSYETSDPMVNKLWNNITWSMRGNFLSIPTDTPARNERMGWSGDINVFSKTATYLAPVNNFMRRHLQGMRDVQRADGRFTDVAPMGGGFGGTLWGSAGIVIPWETYQQYGDKNLLAEHYDAMKRYVAFLASKQTPEGILNEGPLGDWLSPEGNKNDNTAFWMSYQAYNYEIMSKVASILGYADDAVNFTKKSAERKALFNTIYMDATTHKSVKSGVKAATFGPPNAAVVTAKSDKGQVVDTQASYAIPLALGIFDAANKPFAIAGLVDAVKRSNTDDGGVARPAYSLMTGFIGTASISEALSANNQHAEAYRLLTQKTYPSWLYSVANGATTIWERLNSYTVENGFGGNNSMNSFNHYSFGAVAAWMYNHSLGIQRDEKSPGFKHFYLRPVPDPTGVLTHAKGHITSMYGKIASGWSVKGGQTVYTFEIPANTTAELRLNVKPGSKIKEGSRSWKAKGDAFVQELKGGKYTFIVY